MWGEAGRRKRRRNCDWVAIYERIIIKKFSMKVTIISIPESI